MIPHGFQGVVEFGTNVDKFVEHIGTGGQPDEIGHQVGDLHANCPNVPITLAPVKVHGVPRDEAEHHGMELLDKVGLVEHANHTPGELSGGQKQRVAIARSLATRPAVMLFDEVTSALDPELVGEVLGVLKDIAEEGETTMMLATHEMGFAREVADRVVMFDHGRILESGPPTQIMQEPAHERTRSFLQAVLAH